MNPMTLAIGALFVAYGCYTAYARVKAPQQFHKLEAMKKFWGEGPGFVMHVMAYTVMPIVVGFVLILSGFNGRSIIDVMKA